MTEVIMPKMGDGMEEGTLLEWLMKDGDKVKSGDVIGSIQTDKATLELEAPGSGTLVGLLIAEGDTVPVGQPIAAIIKKDEKLPDGWGAGNGQAQAEQKETEQKKDAPAKKEPAAASKPAAARSGRVKSSPLARKLATDAGVDIGTLAGSGPGGRVVAEDVRASIGSGTKVSTIQAAPAMAEDRKVKLTSLKKLMAERTQDSKQTVPHFYVTVEVDVEKIMALRAFFKEEGSGKVSVNDFVIRACAAALQDMPEVNASFFGDHIVIYGSVHVGIAVATDDGLVVPVIKGVHGMTLRQVAAATQEIAVRARTRKLMPEELSGSTFTVSNMGMLNVESFTAIINSPNAAIVAISTAKRRVVPNDDEDVEIRMMMNATGSFDHRIVDGAVGAQFMNVVRDYLENPTRLLN